MAYDLALVAQNIPAQLRELPWCVATRADKRPRDPKTGLFASITDPLTWSDFETAYQWASECGGVVGCVLIKEAGIVAIDVDNHDDCILTDHDLSLQDLVYERFSDTYLELSFSGRGCHAFVFGELPQGIQTPGVSFYPNARFMICTGNVLWDQPLTDGQEGLNLFAQELRSRPENRAGVPQAEAAYDDNDVLSRAERYRNGDLFGRLWFGDWSGYPSQSEADSALISLLCFAATDNGRLGVDADQVTRLFQSSELGQRKKATASYVWRSIRWWFSKRPRAVEVDLATITAALAQAPAHGAAKVPAPSMGATDEGTATAPPERPTDRKKAPLTYPPGVLGELAAWAYRRAIYPQHEAAIVGAIGALVGIVGRQYVTTTAQGLALYLILLGDTGTGKETAKNLIHALFHAVEKLEPPVFEHLGPGDIGSGQALGKEFKDHPCFVSVMGEVGYSFRQWTDPRATPAERKIVQGLLELYSSTGPEGFTPKVIYSDRDKNVERVRAPNFSLIGQSTQQEFFGGLTPENISSGLIPRCFFAENSNPRTYQKIKNADRHVPSHLANHFAEIVRTVRRMAQNDSFCVVELSPEAAALFDAWRGEVDGEINAVNAQKNRPLAEVLTRALENAGRLAALCAVSVEHERPVVTLECAQWAKEFTLRSIEIIRGHIAGGDIGGGPNKQISELHRVTTTWFNLSPDRRNARFPRFSESPMMIPYAFLSQAMLGLAAFRSDARGASVAFKNALEHAISNGEFVEADTKAKSAIGYLGRAFFRVRVPRD